MIGGMDMNQILAGLGNEPGQFGLEGYNSPSGMHGNPFGGGGHGNWQNALSSLGKSFGRMGNRQAGEAPQAMQQGGGPDIQSLLSQLFQDGMGRRDNFGGRFANYLGGQDGLR